VGELRLAEGGGEQEEGGDLFENTVGGLKREEGDGGRPRDGNPKH